MNKAALAVCCVLQCVCAAVAEATIDKRGFGKRPRKNMNTFSTATLEQALEQTQTKWSLQHLSCDLQVFLSIVGSHRAALEHADPPQHPPWSDQVRGAMLVLGAERHYQPSSGVRQPSACNSLQALKQLHQNAATSEATEVCDGFEDVAGLPHVIGAIDGTLIRINRLGEHEDN